MTSGFYPDAIQRPLGPTQLQRRINPSCIILHTMVGSLVGTDSYFRRNGYHGDFSHFGVGGDYDGALEGTVYQWQNTNYQANAQYAGNAYGISIETSDGGVPTRPWSPKQIDSIIALVTYLCQENNIPANTMSKPTDRGIGYHSEFVDWNRDAHTCPGSVRLNQLLTIIIPTVNNILNGDNDEMYMIRTANDGEVDLVIANKVIHLDGPGFDFYKDRGVKLEEVRPQDAKLVRS